MFIYFKKDPNLEETLQFQEVSDWSKINFKTKEKKSIANVAGFLKYSEILKVKKKQKSRWRFFQNITFLKSLSYA